VNFKLKGKECSLKDIELMPGWGPFIEKSAYQSFIANYVDQLEVSVCLFHFFGISMTEPTYLD
jgi:hypothetical protein